MEFRITFFIILSLMMSLVQPGPIEVFYTKTIDFKDLKPMDNLESILTSISHHRNSTDILAIQNWIQLPNANDSMDYLRYKVRYVSTNCTWERFVGCGVIDPNDVKECIATVNLKYNNSVDLQFNNGTELRMPLGYGSKTYDPPLIFPEISVYKLAAKVSLKYQEETKQGVSKIEMYEIGYLNPVDSSRYGMSFLVINDANHICLDCEVHFKLDPKRSDLKKMYSNYQLISKCASNDIE